MLQVTVIKIALVAWLHSPLVEGTACFDLSLLSLPGTLNFCGASADI